MGAKYLRNITKILKSASGVLFGRTTSGTGRGEELTPSQVRSLLSVYTISQTDTAISTAVNALVAGAPGLLDTLDELSAALGDDANFASTVTTALAGKVDSSSLNESIDDRVAALLVAGTNISLTYNDASGTLTIASTAGGLSGTGTVDNAVLRADGTGGATLQNSAIVIDDLYTASPNNTVNVVGVRPTGGTTNVGVSIVPKGSGPFCLSVSDGTTTGGNARGASSIDLSLARSVATQVASGARAVLAGCYSTASGNYSVALGDSNAATGDNTTAVGSSNTASSIGCAIGSYNTASGGSDTAVGRMNSATGSGCFSGGLSNISSGAYSVAVGAYSSATQTSQRARAAVFFSVQGDSQEVGFLLRRKTTDATPRTLSLSHVDATLTRLTIAPGKAFLFDVRIIGIKSDGSAAAVYHRRVAIKNVGGTTSLIGTVQTIGTDIEDNASTDVTITADNTNDALQVDVTGISGETWRWLAVVDGLELAYGT